MTQMYQFKKKMAESFYRLPSSVINLNYRLRFRELPSYWVESPFFFLHVPKTGGISIAKAARLPDPGHVLFSEMRPGIRNMLIHKPCIAVVRDPVDRIVSTYNFAVETRQRGIVTTIDFINKYADVNDFVSDVLVNRRRYNHYFFRPASTFVRDAESWGVSVSVVPFEDVNTKVVTFMKRFGYLIESLPVENRSTEKTATRQDIDQKNIHAINMVFGEDIELREHL